MSDFKYHYVTCPNCNGKGHVFDSASLLFPVFWVFAAFEQNDESGVTRQRCPTCRGAGQVERIAAFNRKNSDQ